MKNKRNDLEEKNEETCMNFIWKKYVIVIFT